MKSAMLGLFLAGLLPTTTAQLNSLKENDLKSLNGETITSAEIIRMTEFTLVVFWKSSGYCCSGALDLLQEAWMDTLRELGVKLVSINSDATGSWAYIRPMVYGKCWDFEVYIDVNGEFARTMGVTHFPTTLLVDNQQNILCRMSGPMLSTSEHLCSELIKHLNVAGGLEILADED